MEFLDYPGMTCEVRGAMSPGNLKLTDDKIVFQHSKSGKKDSVKADEIEMVNWQRLAGVWGIRVFTKSGDLHRFAGFKKGERERVAEHFKTSFSMNMLDKELSVKGWNWGAHSFNGNVLNFEVGGKHDAFEVPLTYVAHCNSAKNEVTLEFSQNDSTSVNLSEMRFHIPSTDQTEEDPAESFKENVMKGANISTASTGNYIAVFPEIQALSPRGRYDIKFHPNFVHLHGKTYDYKIPHTTIMRLILLPHKDQRQMLFCVNLDPPIKQGQTRYHYLVFAFMQDEETELELPYTEEELQDKFEGKLEKDLKGPTFEIISKLMKAFVNKKITVPGNFLGHSGTPAISCSYKAASGFIYPLERGFIFVYKPPIFIRYDEVKNVNFARSGGSNKSFDIEIVTRGDTVYTFSSIVKDEHGKLYEYLKEKKISVKTTGKMDTASKIQLGEDFDHNLAKVKADAESETESGSMSSDDTDFNPDELEAKSAKEEYDSDPSDTDSDSEGGESGSGSEQERKREEKKKRKEARAQKKKTSKPTERTERKKKKKTKLPGQPKKPLSAYFMWMTEVGREKVKEENPGISITEVSKKGGELWREMSESEKKVFEDRAKEAKEAYDKEYKEWLDNGGAEAIKQAKKEAKASKKAAAGGGSPKKKAGGSSASKVKKETTGGSGGSYKSKEFIEDDSESSGGESTKKKSSDKEKSDEEMPSESDNNSE